jgi:hypothetical protein
MGRFAALFVSATCLAAAASCSSQGPTSPSGSLAGATITGSVLGSSGSAPPAGLRSTALGASSGGLTVSVVGTDVSAATDRNGHFALNGVPAGKGDLHFGGNGVDSTLSLDPVGADETVNITVSVSGSSVTLESEARSTGREEQLEGRIESLPPSTPAGTLVVAGRTVTTNAGTLFILHGGSASFSDLAAGERVHVKGQTTAGTLLAQSIDIQNTKTDLPGDDDDEDGGQDSSASIEGPLTAKSGSAPALTLTVSGTTVRTSADTQVQRRGDTQDLTVLATGMTLHVVGTRQGDSSIDARLIQIKDDDAGGAFTIAGPAGGVAGTCPALTFGVNGYRIVTTGGTTFTPACGSLKSGNRVTVTGVVQGDGTILASSVIR